MFLVWEGGGLLYISGGGVVSFRLRSVEVFVFLGLIFGVLNIKFGGLPK